MSDISQYSINISDEELDQVSSSGKELGGALLGEGIQSNTSLSEFAGVTGAVAADVAKQAYEDLIKKLTAKRKVRFKSLINQYGACFSQTPQEFVENISERTSEFTKKLPQILYELSIQYGSAIASDPRFQESFADLAAVQWTANVLEKTYNLYNSVMVIADKFEPYFPIIEIVVSAASIWATGGASAAAFSSQSAQLAMQELKKIIPLIAVPLKNTIYNTEVEVPAYVLGILDFASSAKTKARFAQQMQAIEQKYNIDDASYTEVLNGTSTFKTAYNNFKIQVGTSPQTSAFIRGVLTKVIPSKYTFDIFRPVDYQEASQRVNRDNQGGANPYNIPIKESDIITISKVIIDAKDTSTQFYADRQMLLLVIQELEKDGCVVNAKRQDYDEHQTYLGGNGYRSLFTQVNTTINNFHRLLAVLIGQVRPTITEYIPVIDFYYKNQTGLTSRYTDIVEFNDTEPITNLPREGTNAYAITETDIKSENPPEFNINLAVSGYQVAEYFYNNKNRFSEEKNLVVDFPQGNSLDSVAPGILAGRFNYVIERNERGVPVKWQWINDKLTAYTYGTSVPLGVHYTPYHIWNMGSTTSRQIVEKPLQTATPGYTGLATERYDEIYTFIQTNIINHYSIDTNTWNSLGGIVDSVTLKSYAEETFTRNITETVTRIRFLGWLFSGFKRRLVDTYTRTVTITEKKAVYPEKLGAILPESSMWASKITFESNKYWVNLAYNTNDTIEMYNWKTSLKDQFLADKDSVYGAMIGHDAFRILSITQIIIMSPYELVKNKVSLSGSSKTILFFPDRNYLTNDGFWIISTENLGFSTSSTPKKTLCSIFSNTAIFVTEVVDIYHFDPQFYKNANYRVTVDPSTGGTQYIYEKGITFTVPSIEILGPECWVYHVKGIQVSDPDLQKDFYPIRYPINYVKYLPTSTNRFGYHSLFNGFWAPTFTKLEGFVIAVDLPALGGGETYANYAKKGISFKIADKALGKAVITNYVQSKLKNLPVITFPTGYTFFYTFSRGSITFSELDELLTPWLPFEEIIVELSKSSEFTFLTKVTEWLRRVPALINSVHMLFNSGELLDRKKCEVLDSHFGNNCTPWFSIGDDPEDIISNSNLQKLVSFIIDRLEGTNHQTMDNLPVKYLPGYDAAIGRENSLYYMRYVFLNARMNLQEGTLTKAALYLYNWEFLKSGDLFTSQNYNALYKFIKAEKVESIDPLLYVPPIPEEDIPEGVFYIRDIVDAVRSNIHDKCLLICSPCPVRDTCPFFDEASVLRKYLPIAEYINLWLKDNELDLLVYEQDPASGEEYLDISSETSRLPAQRIIDRHKAFTEIIRDENKNYDIDNLREEIARRVPGFKLDATTYVDDMNWITGGRYGSVELIPIKGAIPTDPHKYRYLYDALFIRDEETCFEYSPSKKYYNVSLPLVEGDTQKNYVGKVRIKEPTDLRIFKDSSGESDVYLISDDTKDDSGKPIHPVIYLGKLKDLVYDFAFDDRDTPVTNPNEWPTAADIAQWCVNQYKWLDATPDQYWMERIKKVVPDSRTAGTKLIELPGRPRVGDVIEPLIEESPSEDDIIRGKPFIKSYTKFIRKFRIKISSIKWVKNSDKLEDVEKAKRTLASMKTNVRLVLVKA